MNRGARILDAFAANREVDAAIYSVLDTRQKLLLRVATLYYELALSRVGLQIARQRAGDGEHFLRIVSARESSGVGLGSDVARARAEFATDRQAVVQAQALWETASVGLSVVLRLDSEILLVPGEGRLLPLDFLPATDTSDAAAKTNAKARPDVEASRKRAEAAAKRFNAAWWDLAGPELAARVRGTLIGEKVSDLEGGENAGVFVGWTLSLEKLSKASERRKEKAIAKLQAVRSKERAIGEARQALRRLQAAREALPLTQEGRAAAQQSRRISLAQFQAGTAIALEVIDAADRLASARLDLARSIVDYNLSQLRVLAATGALEPELLDVPSQPETPPSR